MFRRWLAFNSVGALGIMVQLSVLWLLTAGLALHYMPATALAVEIAVVHNFLWHERWTWADRTRGSAPGAMLKRFFAFNLANGAISLVGNLFLMRVLAGDLGLPPVPANLLAIGVCSLVNFFAGDLLVFAQRSADPALKGGIMKNRWFSKIPGILPILLVLWGGGRLEAAQLRQETIQAWKAYVEATQRRILAELAAPQGFLAMDFLEGSRPAAERNAVLEGSIPVAKICSLDAEGRRIDIPGGAIHHWRGSVLIPGVRLEDLLARIANPAPEDTKQEDVLESAVLERGPGFHVLYLRLERKKIVTVAYNSEHVVRYEKHGDARAFSSSESRRIAELESANPGEEREKPVGNDRGFLWRLNSYWRYEQVRGGVIVECESLTLSRGIPPVLSLMIRPLIDGVARESMQRTLGVMRDRHAAGSAVRALAAVTRPD